MADSKRPDLEKTIRSFEEKLYYVKVFDTAGNAADYLDSQIDGTTVGFGDSRTLIDMKLYDRLASHNTVFDPNQGADNDEFLRIAKNALTTEAFITSVNAIAETGEMVNVDGSGNRVAGSLFGHQRIFFVAGINKIMHDLEQAIWRARNIASPLNSLKYALPTPCVQYYKQTGELKCFDCNKPERICNGLIIYLHKMIDIDDVQIILIKENLGF